MSLFDQAATDPPQNWMWPRAVTNPKLGVRDLVKVFHQVVETTKTEKIREEIWRNTRRRD